jgi:hypothetical protein
MILIPTAGAWSNNGGNNIVLYGGTFEEITDTKIH